MNNDNRDDPPVTHSVSFVPVERDAKGKLTEGPAREIGAVSIRDDGRGFRYLCRRAGDLDIGGDGGRLILRRVEPNERER